MLIEQKEQGDTKNRLSQGREVFRCPDPTNESIEISRLKDSRDSPRTSLSLALTRSISLYLALSHPAYCIGGFLLIFARVLSWGMSCLRAEGWEIGPKNYGPAALRKQNARRSCDPRHLKGCSYESEQIGIESLSSVYCLPDCKW